MAVSNEDLLKEILMTRSLLASTTTTLEAHIEQEAPVLNAAQRIVDVHGEDHDVIRARIAFVNAWMIREAKREAARDKLREAIIEKGTIMALVALVMYLASAIGHDMKDILKTWFVK